MKKNYKLFSGLIEDSKSQPEIQIQSIASAFGFVKSFTEVNAKQFKYILTHFRNVFNPVIGCWQQSDWFWACLKDCFKKHSRVVCL